MTISYKKAGYVFGPVAVFVVALLFTAIIPSFGQSPTEENDLQRTPVSEEGMMISESEDAFPWPPINQPTTGNPVMRIVELQTQPEIFNRINLDEARWLQNVIDRPGERVSMTDEMVQEYFQYYQEVNNHNRYFEVTFPDNAVKYYAVSFTEVP
jgi:hypothetical protein